MLVRTRAPKTDPVIRAMWYRNVSWSPDIAILRYIPQPYSLEARTVQFGSLSAPYIYIIYTNLIHCVEALTLH